MEFRKMVMITLYAKQKEIYYEGSTHTTMESGKSHNLSFASWRPRKASGAVPVHTLRPESQGSQACKSQSKSKPRTLMSEARRKWILQVKQRASSILLHFNVLFRPLTD